MPKFDLNIATVFLIGILAGAVSAWLALSEPRGGLSAAGAIGVVALAFVSLGAYLMFFDKEVLSKEPLEDFIGQLDAQAYDTHGFSFAVFCRNEAGICVIHLVAQNRYASRCSAGVLIQSGNMVFAFEFLIFGGGVTICKKRVSVPREHQGRELAFDAESRAKYPQGYGPQVRLLSGRRIQQDSDTATMVASIALGIPTELPRAKYNYIVWPNRVREPEDGIASVLGESQYIELERDDLASAFSKDVPAG